MDYYNFGFSVPPGESAFGGFPLVDLLKVSISFFLDVLLFDKQEKIILFIF